ncbi:MAG: hypothetical protein Q8R02_24295 [Hyphomonadaceae bacterium]|nr:hypothetical protein [Hyphomonadaceae bacterium]
MAAKAIILAASLLAIAPAVAAAFWPERSADSPTRAVQISGPIIGFTQSHSRIQVRLTPAGTEAEREARSQLVVTDAEGDQFAIPLKRGQTWASAELPHNLADAASLEITVR